MSAGPDVAALLAPGRIGGLELPNRILMTGMGNNLGEPDGTVGERMTAYFEARARGGAAMLVVGSVSVAYPEGSYDARQVALSDDRFVGPLAAMCDRVHAAGSRFAVQLVHDGANSLFDIAAGRPVLVPSRPPARSPDELSMMVTPDELALMTRPFTAPGARMGYREATETDIEQVIDAFASAAARAAAAGFDGVEVHAGHGYLIDSFLSPVANTRADAWGGSLDGRARLLCEVVRAVRARVGDGFPVWFRIDGRDTDRAVAVTKLALEAGADAVNVSANADPNVATGITDGHTPHRPGALVALAAAVKAGVGAGVPVMTVGRLSPAEASAAVARGEADFVGFGRKLLADPDLPRLVAAGRIDEIRPCIYAYRCIGNIFLNEPLRCVANPATGIEHEATDSGRRAAAAADRASVLVVGGGPAGMEAARLLAEAGHDVELWERSSPLGGMLRVAAECDGPLAEFLRWQVGAVERAGVTVSLDREATVDSVLAAGRDAVVLATGAAWPADLAAPVAGDRRVVVLGANVAGLGLAELHRSRGHEVLVHDDDPVAAPQLGVPGRFRKVHDLRAAGVELVLGSPFTPDPGDHVVDARPTTQPSPLAAGLRAAGVAVHVIGDASGVGWIEGALRSAHEVVSVFARSRQ